MRYGLTAFRPGYTRSPRRRHYYWGDGTSKCGKRLVEKTEDMSIPLCRLCDVSMRRLEREQDRRAA
ncbi:hypothetical protein AB0K18_43170 [Nonomuraea sp. NPDC049421]|uniref:hypothetical protein n=1 Tax=Nonomuraea sp. NPDC049421 TaxID=3155275 RepID=UPI003425B73E